MGELDLKRIVCKPLSLIEELASMPRELAHLLVLVWVRKCIEHKARAEYGAR